MNKVKIGITKLVEYIGGFPKGRSLLITGEPGAGKTIFGLQFANNSCALGLNTLYISTEEKADDLCTQAEVFDFELERYRKENILSFMDLPALGYEGAGVRVTLRFMFNKGNFSELLNDVPKDTDTLIIDNLGGYISKMTPHDFKDELDTLNYHLYTRGITTLIILDSATSNEFDNLALYSSYGAIHLMKHDNPYTGKRERVMDVVKMRGRKTPTQLIPYEITEGEGIEIISDIE